MADVAVQFRYLTGLKRRIFRNARLVGNWDPQGRQSLARVRHAMTEIIAEDGCPAFTVAVHFDASEVGKPFEWCVRLDRRWCPTCAGSPPKSTTRTGRIACVASSCSRRAAARSRSTTSPTLAGLGARKVFSGGRSRDADLRFAVWAPNARNVEVVFGDPANGYIADDGRGIDPARPPLAMTRGPDGIWQSAAIPDFAALRGPALHVSHHERPGARGVPHRSLLASADRSRHEEPQGRRAGTGPGHARWHQEL